MRRVNLGTVGHFGIAVRDPDASFAWWSRSFDMRELLRGNDYILMTNENVTIVLRRGDPRPDVLGHVSFHVPTRAALDDALDILKANGVTVEDPGNEVGPEAPGSPNLGLWFHDPDGYRWELSLQAR